RDPGCDRVFARPTVSGRHARLSRAGGRALIEDLGSANGTSVNGEQIVRAVPVAAGDRIGLGSFALRLAIAAEAPEELIELTDADLIGPGPPAAPVTRPRIADAPWPV